MKYATLDAAGRPIAYYSADVHGEDIPAGAIAISEQQWRECINHPGRRKIMMVDGTAVVKPYTPKLADAQAQRIRNIKQKAFQLLQPSDWYVVRHAETDEPVPAEIASYRAAVRATSDDAEAAIAKLNDPEAVLEYQVAWPPAP